MYEHMRVQHVECGDKPGPGRPPMVPGKSERLSLDANSRRRGEEHPSKPPSGGEGTVQVQATKPVVVQIPTFAQSNHEADTSSNALSHPQVQTIAANQGGQQQVTLQIPQVGDGSQVGQQQQLVILMPQQVQGIAPSQQQFQATPQPIVILMPQTGGQAAQPVVVPVPQVSPT